MTEFKVQASVKDNDGDMVNFRADSPEELTHYLENFPYGAYAQAKASLRGAGALGGISQPQGQQQQAAPPQQQAPASNGWGQPTQQQVQTNPPQRGGNRFGGQLHPEGKQCQCGQVLEVKKTSSGKTVFRCPSWRWNNGNPTPDHDQVWGD